MNGFLFLVLAAAAQDPVPEFGREAAARLRAAGVEELLFVKRFTLDANHVYTEHVNSRWAPGGGLAVLDLRTGKVRDVLPSLASGVTNRFDLSFDGKRIVYDHKPSPLEGYRLREVGVDGRGDRFLTGPESDEADLARRFGSGGYAHGTDDMHPCILPDGAIVFSSTRVRRSVLCDSSDTFTSSVLHRLDASGIRPLSGNAVSEFSPALLPDGRILYMRWEYNRKGAGAVKCLWSMRPDGSASEEVYGNAVVDPETMIYGRPVPGAPGKIVFLGASHWGPNNALGTVILLDTGRDASSRDAMTWLTPEVDARAHDGFHFLVDGRWVHDRTGKPGPLYKDPYPVTEDLVLAAHKPKGPAWNDPKAYGLVLIDGRGGVLPLYRDPSISCWHPYPIRPRPVPPTPPTPTLRADLEREGLAQVLISDVVEGMTGVPRGAVRHLRVMEQVPRPWEARNRWKGDQDALAHTSIGAGLLGLPVQHGIVPVEADGSANLLVPAGRNVFLQALDEHFRAVQTERTYVNYRAGEVRSCTGCHDRRRVPALPGAAASREPSRPGPMPGDDEAGQLYDYARRIQPIWDRHCVSCHGPGGEAAPDLTGEPTRLYNRSYEALLGLDPKRRPRLPLTGVQVDENDVRAWVEATPPWQFGAASSLLGALVSDAPPRFEGWGGRAAEMEVRARELRAAHPGIALSAAERVRVFAWLDAGRPFHPSYWGMKNLAHRGSPAWRPSFSFAEALAPDPPGRLRSSYALPAR